MKKAALLFLIFSSTLALGTGGQSRIVVLANPIDFELASELFDFFKSKGAEVVHASASNFEGYSKERLIIILGGPDAYEGVGEIVQEVIEPEEQDYLRIAGNKKLYVKTNVWARMQRVCIIAGSDRYQTQKAHLKNKEKLAQILNLEEDPALTEARSYMLETHLKGRDITDEGVLKAMGSVPRHKFVDRSLQEVAYADRPLPIGEGQTISQPYVVALMTQALHLNGGERVLEIGTGSGYQAAILAELTQEVYTIEIKETLAKSAEERLAMLGYTNVHVKNGDGYFGWEEHAPFDAIMITAAVNHIPPPLIEQLDEGGKLILPLGSTAYYQTMTVIEKRQGELQAVILPGFYRFVPMTGEALRR